MLILFLAGAFLSVLLGVLALHLTRTLPARSVTNILVHIFLLAAALLTVFAYWGQYIASGRRAFDEMDGIYPFLAGPLATLLAAAAALAGWLGRRRSRSQSARRSGLAWYGRVRRLAWAMDQAPSRFAVAAADIADSSMSVEDSRTCNVGFR